MPSKKHYNVYLTNLRNSTFSINSVSHVGSGSSLFNEPARFFRQVYREGDYYVIGLCLLSLFPIYDFAPISVVTAVYVLLCILTWIKKGRPRLAARQPLKLFFTLSSFYLVLWASALYSNSFSEAMKLLLKQLPLLVFPLTVIMVAKYSERFRTYYREVLIYLFCAATFLVQTLIFYTALSNSDTSLFHSGGVRRVMQDYSKLDLHPSYISLYALTAILFLFSTRAKGKKALIAKAGISIYFLIGIFTMSSKAIILATILVVPLLALFAKKQKLLKFLLICFAMVGTSYIVYYNVPTVKARFETVYREARLPNFRNPSTTPMRTGVYQCAYQLIGNQVLFGYGIGDVQHELDRCYDQYTTDAYKIREYNSHNYYFYLMLSGGLVALCAFLFALYYQLRVSITGGDWAYFSFLIITMVFLLTENALVRSYGITYYCFFSTFCLLSNRMYQTALKNN